MLLDQLHQIRGPRRRRPADGRVPGRLMPACGRIPEAAETAVARRHDPEVEYLPRPVLPTLRMMGLHHLAPAAPVRGRAHRDQGDRPEIRQRARQLPVRIGALHLAARTARRAARTRPRLGQQAPRPLRDPGQNPARLGHAGLAPGVAPVLAFAQLARQRMTRPAGLGRRRLQPLDRVGAEMSKSDLHAVTMTDGPTHVKCGGMKGYDPCRHPRCGRHLLRELAFVVESHGYRWARWMKSLLREVCHRVHQSASKALNETDRRAVRTRYRTLLTQGAKELPDLPPRTKGTRGRIATSDAHNLHERLGNPRRPSSAS